MWTPKASIFIFPSLLTEIAQSSLSGQSADDVNSPSGRCFSPLSPRAIRRTLPGGSPALSDGAGSPLARERFVVRVALWMADWGSRALFESLEARGRGLLEGLGNLITLFQPARGKRNSKFKAPNHNRQRNRDSSSQTSKGGLYRLFIVLFRCFSSIKVLDWKHVNIPPPQKSIC